MVNFKKIVPSFPKGVLFISFASLMTDVAGEAIYPLLPIFLSTTLGAGALSLGLIEGVAETTASLLKFFFGWYSDRIRKSKVFVLVGYSLGNLMKPLVGLATAWPQVLVIRFLDRVGKGIRTAPRDAWLSTFTTKDAYPKVYGFHRGMDHLGAVLGPLLAGVYLSFYHEQYRSLFLWTLIPGFLGVLFIFLTPEAPKAPVVIQVKQSISPIEGWKLLPKKLKKYFLLLFIFSLGNSSDTFLILRLREGGVSIPSIPLLWAVLHIVKMVSSFFSSQFVDRYGVKKTLLLGWGLYALVYLGFATLKDTSLLVSIFILYGLFFGLTEGPEKAMIATLTVPEQRGSAFGVYAMTLGLTALPASLLFGVIWKFAGMHFAFIFGGTLALIAAILFLFSVEESK